MTKQELIASLTAENQELGRKIDEVRARRAGIKLLLVKAMALPDEPAPEGSVSVEVGGELLIASTDSGNLQ